MPEGGVVKCKRDVDGNTIFRGKQNPILDHQQYEVDFSNDEVMELTENIIDERMYAQGEEEVNYIFRSIIL